MQVSGEETEKSAERRFVVLRHEMPPGAPRAAHWDLMLEAGETLRTWALAQEPTGGNPLAATELPPHRLAYLDYEGPVSGDRGQVSRWDQGTYRISSESHDHLIVEIAGTRLRGIASFKRLAGNDQWLFRFSSGRMATSGWPEEA